MELSIREVRNALPHLDRLLEEHGEVMVTRRGKPIARVLPIARKSRVPSHRALRRSMPRLEVGSEKLLRRERDER